MITAEHVGHINCGAEELTPAHLSSLSCVMSSGALEESSLIKKKHPDDHIYNRQSAGETVICFIRAGIFAESSGF